VTRKVWHAAVAFAENWLALRESTPRWLWQQPPGTLTVAEQTQLHAHGRGAGPVHLGSAMFRRCGLLRGTMWITVWANDELLLVEWPGTPAPAEIAADLRDPICGLGDAFRQHDTDPESARLVEEDRPAELLLRTVPAHDVSAPSDLTHWPEEFFTPWRDFEETTADRPSTLDR
jgi:hypothetical protein